MPEERSPSTLAVNSVSPRARPPQTGRIVQQLEMGVSTMEPDATAVGGKGKRVDTELDDAPTSIDAVDAFFSRLVCRLEHCIEWVGQ